MVVGRFITVEGGEGVGKSSFAEGLSRALNERGIPLKRGREPGGSFAAERIRSFWAQSPEEEPWLPMTELCLVSAARAQHLGNTIRPTLEQGVWYLCDRFSDSSRVYQGKLGGLSQSDVEAIIRASTNGLSPDLSFLLDCDVRLALARIAQGRADPSAVTRYDQKAVSFHENVRVGFLELAKRFPDRMVILDASKPLVETIALAVQVLEERFFGL